MAEPLNTGLSAQQVLTAFDRALNDYTDAEIDALLSAKQDTIADISEIRSGAAAGATAVQPATLAAETAAREAADSEMQDEIEQKVTLTDIYGVKPSIASGTDLNDMTTPGCYACGGASLAVSLLNCPTTTDAFIMYVDSVAAESRSIQRLYTFNTITGLPAVYIRSRYSGGWSAWYKFEGTVVS